jgi:hypothetical protein
MTLAERIAELEQSLTTLRATAARYEERCEVVPRIVCEGIAAQQDDLGWFRELDSLRAITRGILAGDHEAISRGLLAALGDELVLRVIHELLTRLAKEGTS